MPSADALAWAYPLALWTHIALVIASVGLFTARGLGVLAGQAWPMRQRWRRMSMGIDAGLLGAGATLWALLQFNPLHDQWLGAKLVLLVVYIALGMMALKRARANTAKAVFFVASLLCVTFMASIALNHSPLGWWA